MHRIDPPFGVLDEPTYLLKVSVQPIHQSEVQEKIHLLEKEAPPGEQANWELWITRVHLNTEALESGDYTYYRRDVPCGNLRLLRLKAEVRTTDVSGRSYKVEDDATARRMLNSARCDGKL